MSELFWRFVAYIVSRRPIRTWLIERSFKTPYHHLEGYMDRFWLFNSYTKDENLIEIKDIVWLPSIRINHIKRADLDSNCHDHPWIKARTIIMLGWYREERVITIPKNIFLSPYGNSQYTEISIRRAGDTATLNNGEFHRITDVSPGGVWTLFITWKQTSDWGFLVDGKKIPYKEYSKRGETKS